MKVRAIETVIPYGLAPGLVIENLNDELAEEWIAAGWVEAVHPAQVARPGGQARPEKKAEPLALHEVPDETAEALADAGLVEIVEEEEEEALGDESEGAVGE